MAWPEISIDDFPHRRDDEPSSLRQDIIDELSDHFACALNRELLKNPDEQTAKQRVLNEFGDPIKIARQLWLEAMKEKIMSQRIMTGISAVMAVCCIAVVGIAWMLMKDSQGVNQKMLEQLAVIAGRPAAVVESQTEEQILQELKQLNQKQTAQSGSASEVLNQISLQLVQLGEDEKPAVGFSGELVKVGDIASLFKVRAVSDETGKLDFGKLPWGRYAWKLQAPWGETCAPWSDEPFANSFVTIPGRDYSETLICPENAPADVPIRFHVNWPEKLKSDDWVLICDFRYQLKGMAIDQIPIGRKEPASLTFNSVRTYQKLRWINEQGPQQPHQGVYLISGEDRVNLCPLTAQGAFENLSSDVLTDQTEIQLKQGEYHLPVVYLIRKGDLQKLSELNSSKKVGFKSISDLVQTLSFYPKLEHKTNISCFINPFEQLKVNPEFEKGYGKTQVAVVHGIELKKSLKYSASKEQPDIWEIDVPEMEFVLTDSSASNNNP